MLEVYTEVLDYLQWSSDIDDGKAQKVLSVISYFKRLAEDTGKINERYKQALEKIEDLPPIRERERRSIAREALEGTDGKSS